MRSTRRAVVLELDKMQLAMSMFEGWRTLAAMTPARDTDNVWPEVSGRSVFDDVGACLSALVDMTRDGNRAFADARIACRRRDSAVNS